MSRAATESVRFCRNPPLAARPQTRTAYTTIETCGVRKRGWTEPNTRGRSRCSAIAKVRRGTFTIPPAREPKVESSAQTARNPAPGAPRKIRSEDAREVPLLRHREGQAGDVHHPAREVAEGGEQRADGQEPRARRAEKDPRRVRQGPRAGPRVREGQGHHRLAEAVDQRRRGDAD